MRKDQAYHPRRLTLGVSCCTLFTWRDKMIGFQLLRDVKNVKSQEERDEIIAKAFEEIEAKSVDMTQIATKRDLADLELRMYKYFDGKYYSLNKYFDGKHDSLNKYFDGKHDSLNIRLDNFNDKLRNQTLVILTAMGVFSFLSKWIIHLIQ